MTDILEDIGKEVQEVTKLTKEARCPKCNGIQVEQKDCYRGRYIQRKCCSCGYVEDENSTRWRVIAKRWLEKNKDVTK